MTVKSNLAVPASQSGTGGRLTFECLFRITFDISDRHYRGVQQFTHTQGVPELHFHNYFLTAREPCFAL